jgi:citrate synthase
MSERIAQLMKEKKNLNANVDFYSATVYYSLGIPTDLFTPSSRSARCAAGAPTSSNSWRITGSIVR